MVTAARLIILGLLLKCCGYVYAQLHSEPKLKRLAVIGSGMGGATAAWLIHNATGCDVTVFEASDVVGGHLKETSIDERVVELGGSIGIEANRYFVETTERLGLHRRSQPSTSVGIWDGTQFVFKSSDSMLSKFFRYGVSPFVLSPIVKDAVAKFNQVYDLQEAGNAYETAEDLWQALGLAHLMNVTLHDYLQNASRFFGFPLINHNYITEAAAASTRVNYNQNPSVITALAGLIALAPNDGAFTVDGGTGQMPAGLLKLAKADVKLSHHVSAVTRSGTSWKVTVGSSAAQPATLRSTDGTPMQGGDQREAETVGGWWGDDTFDAVIIAAPLNSSGISIHGLDDSSAPGSGSDGHTEVPGDTIDYQTVYTTYVQAKLRQEYFYPDAGAAGAESAGVRGDEQDLELPGFIGTAEGSAAGFSCIGTLNASVDGNGTRLMKLFSREKLPQTLLDSMFVEPQVPAEHRWKAYPVFRVPEREEGRMRVAGGLYYVNALEAGASCIEIAAVAARNVAALLLRDLARGEVAGGVAAAERAARDTVTTQQEL